MPDTTSHGISTNRLRGFGTTISLYPYLLCLLLVGTSASAQQFDHSAWDRLLQKNVDSRGLVNYKAFSSSDKSEFLGYQTQLAAARPEAWKPSERLAFWINAYNASAIAGVLKRYPTKSIYPSGDQTFFEEKIHNVAGQLRSLNEIEKQILLREFGDARLHFVLVCSAVGCPLLSNRAYVGSTVWGAIDSQTRFFIHNPQKVRVDPQEQKLYLSRIFDWYRADFVRAKGSVVDFVQSYFNSAQLKGLSVEYLEYDWSLNDRP